MQAPIPATAHAVRLALCGAVALSLLCAAATSAGSDAARLTVSATIPKRASVDVLRQPSSVTVTAADITRPSNGLTSWRRGIALMQQRHFLHRKYLSYP